MDFDPTKDYYKILGVDSRSTEKQIKEQYYKLAKKHHPDLNNGVSSDYFKEMTAAYEILSDQEKKQKYDQLRNYSNGGFWNTTNNSQQNTSNNSYGKTNYSNFNSQNYYNTSGNKDKYYKMWQFTYVDPKTGQKKTFNFNEDAFKNFDEFISKMRSEMKTDFSKSESFKQQEERSRKDFFGNNYYEKNKFYYENKKPKDSFQHDDFQGKNFNEQFDFQYKFFKRLNLMMICGSLFLFFGFLSLIRRPRYNENVYYEHPNQYSDNTFPQSSPYDNPYQQPYNPYQHNPYQNNPYNQQPFKPINIKSNYDPYASDLPPRYK